MKISETLKTKKAEETFSATLVVVLLLILPMWGAVAMLVGSAIGLVAYAILFRERLRIRGWLKTVVIPIAVAAALGAAIAVALSRGNWY
jgi:hypothetical protein